MSIICNSMKFKFMKLCVILKFIMIIILIQSWIVLILSEIMIWKYCILNNYWNEEKTWNSWRKILFEQNDRNWKKKMKEKNFTEEILIKNFCITLKYWFLLLSHY